MLVLEEKFEEQATRKNRFFIVDMHHHLGREEKVKNLNPAGPDGSYLFLKSVFWGNQWKPGLIKELEENGDDYKFSIPEDRKITEPHPCIGGLMDLGFEPFGLDIPAMFKDTFLSDLIVAFPMDDTYQDKEVGVYSDNDQATPKYAYSNNKIIDITSRFPNSLRFIPFGRVAPSRDDAFKEMVRAVDGLEVKGFKLHPKSDGYAMEDECVVDALVMAAKLDVPALFHTSFIQEVRDLNACADRAILKLVKEAGFEGNEDHNKLDRTEKERFREMTRVVNSLRVVIGHCGWHTSPELFDILKHPCIYGEISGIKGDVVRRFFKTAFESQGHEYDNIDALAGLEAEGVSRENLRRIFPPPNSLPQYRGWSTKIMFGTDFPFLDQNQAIDVFRSLLGTEFPGTSRDIANFLGLNALKLLFPARDSSLAREEAVKEKPHELFEPLLVGYNEKNLKKTQVNISFLPGFSNYPYAYVGKGFQLDVGVEGEAPRKISVDP